MTNRIKGQKGLVNINTDKEDIVYRLLKRAEIRRQISGRKSVQEGKPDRIADLLEEAANEIIRLRGTGTTDFNNLFIPFDFCCKTEK